jgi:thiol-disulfide isomerase/thioredoxin
MKKINPWMIITIILVLVIVGLLFGRQITGMFIVLTPEDIANNAMDYLNKNFVAPNTTATFLSVSEFHGVYNITFSYEGQELSMYVTKDGSYVFISQPLKIGEELPKQETPKVTIGNFVVDEKSEICKEDEKVEVYFFGSQKCPHCMWEHPIVRNITELFKDHISFHENIDTEKDKEVFLKYSPRGYIPLIVIGCRYYRIGSGEEIGEDVEAQILAALICSVTNYKPLSICAQVEDIINQVG